MIICRAYEQLTPVYDNVSGTSKDGYHKAVTKFSTYFPVSQIDSGN